MQFRSSRLLVTFLALLAFVFTNVQSGGTHVGNARTAMAAGIVKSDCKCNHGSCQAQCPAKALCFAGCVPVLPPAELAEFDVPESGGAQVALLDVSADGLAAQPLFRPPRA